MVVGALSVLAVLYDLCARPLYELGPFAVGSLVVGPVAPQFLAPTLLYFAFFVEALPLLVFATLLSAPLDLLSLDPAGAHAAALLPALILVGRFRGWFVVEAALLRWTVLLPALLLGGAARCVWVALFSGDPWAGSAAIAGSWSDVFLCALYTTLLSIPVHGLLDRFRQELGWSRDRSLVAWRQDSPARRWRL
jgi:cell shape-determining protein MreD